MRVLIVSCSWVQVQLIVPGLISIALKNEKPIARRDLISVITFLSNSRHLPELRAAFAYFEEKEYRLKSPSLLLDKLLDIGYDVLVRRRATSADTSEFEALKAQVQHWRTVLELKDGEQAEPPAALEAASKRKPAKPVAFKQKRKP